MNVPRFLCIVVFLSVFSLGFKGSNDNQTEKVPGILSGQAVMSSDEELVYEVSWTFFKLGTIRIKARKDYTAEARIDSYEGVPFVDLHSIHYTIMDSAFFSHASRTVEKKEGEWKGLDYLYDLPNKLLVVQETVQKDPRTDPYRRTVRDTLLLPTSEFVDGLSIAYYPRRMVHTVQTVDVPTVLYGKFGTTTFRLRNNRTTEQIDVLDDPVRVIEIEGTTGVEGVFGMSGDFKGWFSDDDAAVPIKGKLKVLLGNVNVELIQWKRGGWNPPR